MIRPATGNTGNPVLPRNGWKPWPRSGGSTLKAANNLSPIFKEFLSLLIEEKAEFALVGGWAVAFHGYPRFTGDMDILVNPTPENSAKVIKVLHRFGFGSLSIGAEDLQAEANVIQLGDPPLRIDIITSLDGIANDEVFSGATTRDFYGLQIPIISKEHLVKNKKATGRTQDLLDLENLE